MALPNLDLHNLEQVVLEKCDSFVRLNVWPPSDALNYRGWLGNFDDDRDRTYALHLLNAFTFYNSEMCAALLLGSIQSLSIKHSRLGTMKEAMAEWSDEINRTTFVPVEGERPNMTDSGTILAGVVRRRLQVPQNQFKPFDQVLLDVAQGRARPNRIVFFDDFIGSGQQFVTLMTKPRMSNIPYTLLTSAGCEIVYCCFVATTYGLENVALVAPLVQVLPAHIIDETHSVVAPDSRVWPSELRADVDDFVLRASRKAKIADDGRLGFHDLGLALAFEHTIPDASLPLFYSPDPAWHPLMRRS